MAWTDRLVMPLPHGQRAYVVSDLELGPDSEFSSSAVSELVRMLDDIDDAAVFIVAGNLFAPCGATLGAEFIEDTFRSLPELRRAIQRFGSEPYRRFVMLPGHCDWELMTHEAARNAMALLGVEVAHDVMLQVATAYGTRDLAVAVGRVPTNDDVVSTTERPDAQRLEDPSTISRFAASRLLYRRLSKWVWFPLWAIIAVDVAGSFVALYNRWTHHHVHLHSTHPRDVFSEVIISLLVVAMFEALLALIAAWVVQRRYRRHSIDRGSGPAGEPLAATLVDETDSLEFARRVAERGGAGAVIGGSPRPALAFLDRGVCGAPGPSRSVVLERRGHLGLPAVFTNVERLGVVEIEAATAVRVRLLAKQSPAKPATRLERWVAGAAVLPEPPDALTTIAIWPSGDPWPLAMKRMASQRRQRMVRRLASFLLLLTGLADVAIAAAPPLRGRLHAELMILPIGVVQSATAVSAIAGFAMFMMARGVRRGQRRAWFVAVVMLLVTIGIHLIRGGSARGSIVAIVVLAILLFGRESFTATTDHASVRSVIPRLGLIGLFAIVAATFGIEFTDLTHRNLPSWPTVVFGCIERLVGITTVAFPDRVSDFVDPALLTIGAALIVTGLYFVTRPVVDRRLSEPSTSPERRFADLRARDLVRRHGCGTLDYFALRDDKQFFFHRDSLVAYAVYGGVALLSPDPIGPAAERTEAFLAFRNFAESQGWTIGIMGASEEWLTVYQSVGLHCIYLGDEAVVNCSRFSLQGGKMKGLRQACTRIARNGYTVEFFDPATINPTEISGVLALISKLRRGEGERGFSMMLGRLFDPRDQGLLLTIVKDARGVPAAVCQFVPSPSIKGFSLDLMRRDPDEHPNGLIDFALCSTIAHLRELGAEGLSMNFAAFRSVLDGERGDGTLTRVERWALKRLSGVLPIESLWSFNAKYDPDWLPRYLVYPAAESFVPVVAATLRAEALTEIPVIGRLLANDPSNRPGTVVPDEILEQVRRASSLQ